MRQNSSNLKIRSNIIFLQRKSPMRSFLHRTLSLLSVSVLMPQMVSGSSCRLLLSFDRDMLLSLYNLLILLRDAQSQDTVLEFRLDIFIGDIIAYIEASLHCSCAALSADICAFLVLFVFIETLRR